MTPRQASPQRFPKMELSRFPSGSSVFPLRVHTTARSLTKCATPFQLLSNSPASERPATKHQELLSRPEPSSEQPPSEALCAWPLNQACSASHASRYWSGCHRVGVASSPRSKHCATGGHLIPCFAPEGVDEIPIWSNKHSGICAMTVIRVNVGLAGPP